MIFKEVESNGKTVHLNPLDILLLTPTEGGALIYMIGRSSPVAVVGVPSEIAQDINAAIGIDEWLAQAYRWDGEAWSDAWVALAHSSRIQADADKRILIHVPGSESPWIYEIPEGSPSVIAGAAARLASQLLPTPIREVAAYRSESAFGAYEIGIESVSENGSGEAIIELSEPQITQDVTWQCIAQIEGATAGTIAAQQTDSRTWRIRRFDAAGTMSDLPWAARWTIVPAL